MVLDLVGVRPETVNDTLQANMRGTLVLKAIVISLIEQGLEELWLMNAETNAADCT